MVQISATVETTELKPDAVLIIWSRIVMSQKLLAWRIKLMSEGVMVVSLNTLKQFVRKTCGYKIAINFSTLLLSLITSFLANLHS
ncbi:hypothetical protein HS5_05960 [Acidianus sp. HS-5]|nr:hypothetical protein HS5_05960 [Acidianus sp. HS-5]